MTAAAGGVESWLDSGVWSSSTLDATHPMGGREGGREGGRKGGREGGRVSNDSLLPSTNSNDMAGPSTLKFADTRAEIRTAPYRVVTHLEFAVVVEGGFAIARRLASGFGVWVPGTGFRVLGFGFRLLVFRFWISSFGFLVSGFGFRVSGFGFRVLGFGFRVSGLV